MAEVVLDPASDSPLGRSHRGAASELLVCAALIGAGYHVYRAESPHAPFDLVAYQDGVCQRVEVRSITVHPDERHAPTFPWPKHSDWDLLAVAGIDRIFFFDAATAVDEARDIVRVHYGFEPLSSLRPANVCGTMSGYTRHKRAQEPGCSECMEAMRTYYRAQRARLD